MQELFPHGRRDLADQALREFSRTTLGKAVQELSRSGSSSARRSQGQKIHTKLSNQWNSKRMADELGQTSLGELTNAVMKYSRRGGLFQSLFRETLRHLGPTGRIIEAAAKASRGSNDVERQLSAATNLLRAFGFSVQPGGRAKVGETNFAIRNATDFLRSMGYEVKKKDDPRASGERRQQRRGGVIGIGRQPPPGHRTDPGTPTHVPPPPSWGGEGGGGNGNDPLYSGEMQPADNSSNVHSFGYDIVGAYLYVRYLLSDGDGTSSQPGSLYRYAHISPIQFNSILRAPSKGTWIWDNIRIRGTVSGHRHDYELVGITNDYVPRKATMSAKGEMYVQRTIRTTGDRWLTSELPDALANDYRPRTGGTEGYRPRDGRPNDGSPRN